MSIADRREREKQMRRESIIDAAEKIFFVKGVAASTMDEIADTAELSKGTIYLYFKTKEDLYVGIVERCMHQLIDMFRKATESASTGLEKVKGMGRALFAFYEECPCHFSALFYHHESIPVAIDLDDPRLKPLVEDTNTMAGISFEAIRAGISDGSIRPDVDPKKASFALYSMLLGLIRMVAVEEKYMLKKFELRSQDLIAYAFDLIEHALGRPHD
jgi:TetR/AcrR family transcriptional regulator